MNQYANRSKSLTWLKALVLTGVMAGCGGGGGGGGSATTTVEGQGNFGAGIVGGTVQMVCAGSTPGTTVTTSATGGFTVTAPGSAPCVIKISGGNLTGGPFYSIFEAGQTRANVNQLTTMLAFLLADGNPEAFFTSPSTISTKITAAAVATDKETVRASVIANLAGAVTPAISTSFDFLQTAFTADSTGFDQMLDKLGFASTGNTAASVTFNGAPILEVNPTTNVASTTTSTPVSSTTLAAAGPSGTGGTASTVLPGVAGTTGAQATNPTVISSNPSDAATGVPTSTNGTGNVLTGKVLTATFNQAMTAATITAAGTFTLKETTSGTNVPGTVTMNAANTIATFTPTAGALAVNTQYTATVTTAAKTAGSIAMAKSVAWSFTTNATLLTGQAPVNLLTAGNFVILATAQITDVASSAITGDIGLSPAAGSFIFVSCAEMAGGGKIYAVDAAYAVTGFAACSMPGPGANKTLVDNAVLDMGTARADAAGRSIPDTTESGVAGEIGGLNIAPGLHKWSTDVLISTNVTLTGGANDVWIFQIAGDLAMASMGDVPTGIKVVLAGGAKASNVFWQVGGGTGATLGTFSTFNGIILSAAQVIAQTGAVVNGRLFADTQVTLDMNPVTQPAP